MNLTPYHANYFAHELTLRVANGIDRLSMPRWISIRTRLKRHYLP